MWVVMAVAVGFAVGLWLLVDAVWPAPRPLSAALARLHAPGEPRRILGLSSADDSLAGRVGRWVVTRVRGGVFNDERTLADLAILRRPVELHAGIIVLGAVAGEFSGPVLWTLATASGSPLPVVVPIWFLVAGAVAGFFLPRLLLRSEAATARRDFRHALGAYLDVLVLLLAAQEGPESAMELASQAGRGPAFEELRQATWQARLSGDAVWATLDDLGARMDIIELREIAAAGSLAGESGAAVRKSLTAKARALRTASLASAEAAARRQSQAMFAPLVILGMGFILFMIYPLVTNITVGGS